MDIPVATAKKRKHAPYKPAAGQSFAPAIPLNAMPPKERCILNSNSYELLSYLHDTCTGLLTVNLLAKRDDFGDLIDPVDVHITLASGYSIHGHALNIGIPKWITARIVSLTLSGTPDSITYTAPSNTPPT